MKTKSTHLMKGLLISLLLIIVGLIQFSLDDYKNQMYGWIDRILIIVGIMISCVLYSKEQNETVNFKKIFGYGFKTTALVIIIMIAYQILFVYVIDPNLKDKIVAISVEEMQKNNMPNDQIDVSIGYIKNFFIPGMIAGTIFGNLYLGVIGSLIGAAISKKNKIIDNTISTENKNEPLYSETNNV